MKALLSLAYAVDRLNEGVGRWVRWLALGAVLVSAGNALVRYTFLMSSNAWLEIQWYMFSGMFLLAAGDTLRHNDHVRLDVLFLRFSSRTQAWIDIFGTLVFLLPISLLILWLSWPFFLGSFLGGETSADPGGLIRWPVKILVPLGFLLLCLQGLSELVKRIAFLLGQAENPLHLKEKVR